MSAFKLIKWIPPKTYTPGFHPSPVELIEDVGILDTRPKKGVGTGEWFGIDIAPCELEVDVSVEGIPLHGSPRVQIIVNEQPSKPFLFYEGQEVYSGVSLKLKSLKGLKREDPWILNLKEGEEVYKKEFITQENLPSITYHRTLIGPGQWTLEVQEQKIKFQDIPLWGYGCIPHACMGLDQWQQSWGHIGADANQGAITVLDSNQLKAHKVFPSPSGRSGGELSRGSVLFMDPYDLTKLISLKGALMSGMSVLTLKSTVEMPPGFEGITYKSRRVQELDPNLNQLRITYELQRRGT